MSGVRWVQSNTSRLCDECGDPTAPGDRVALWTERIFTEYWGTARLVRRHYCETCGRHLEDSLIPLGAAR